MTTKATYSRKETQNITIIDVARESGVSYSTVSRVLNGYEYVRESTRRRVSEAAVKLGYVANIQARRLAGGDTQVIGLLVPSLNNSYINEILRGADHALLRCDYTMMVYTTHRFQDKESDFAKSICNGSTDGLLLIVPHSQLTYLDSLQQQNFPYVLIDQCDPSGNSSVVDSTNWQGAYNATTYLIKLGHRKIAHITGNLSLNSAIDRVTGYKTAMEDNNIPIREDYILEGNYHQRLGYTLGEKLITMADAPTAIFAGNDQTAFGVMEAARSYGLSIPENLSVIGFDDIPQATITYPKLTTIHQSLRDMGEVAVQLLLERVKNPQRSARRITLATHLIERETCRAI